ncbi:helix-turn-helix transcriptional regulator [Streptomyces sp. t39]|uniref:helix-turn-helix transcriptional regulator n=1 Tax=Streptomyces sp. t39 TaxID=1828156 RepID=UPI0011CE200F|nr:AraC family transcriptional regulator [Streptomyces sp. t39]TXS57617.1 AraC family transcriptional regulator [Streptomyces sp. t39]
MAVRHDVRAWRPSVPGVREVLHAHFTEHAYPMHVHDDWTLLIVDDGAVRYDLDHHRRGTPGDTVSLLPPLVPHNGSPATAQGFRKRVLYLDTTRLDETLIGPAVDGPDLTDPLLRTRIGQLHSALAVPGDELEAESRLTLIAERLRAHLSPGAGVPGSPVRGRGVAQDLRDLLDERLCEGASLEELGRLLHVHPAHLVRSFSAAFGIPPHRYVMSRRVDLARRRLLAGQPPGEVAAALGFYDQPHFTRHFKRILGTTPGRYARTATGRGTGSVPPAAG